MNTREKRDEPRRQLLKDVDKIVNKVSKVTKVHSIIFFGSTARGDVNETSDIDLLLVCNNDTEARKVVHHLNHHFEITIYSPQKLMSMAKLGLPIMHHLAKEALVLKDDGHYRKAIKNLRETNMETLKTVSSEVHKAPKVYSTLSEFNLAYFAHIFGPLLNLIETRLCMQGAFIFNKEDAIKTTCSNS